MMTAQDPSAGFAHNPTEPSLTAPFRRILSIFAVYAAQDDTPRAPSWFVILSEAKDLKMRRPPAKRAALTTAGCERNPDPDQNGQNFFHPGFFSTAAPATAGTLAICWPFSCTAIVPTGCPACTGAATAAAA
jgi:hypothetical protein